MEPSTPTLRVPARPAGRAGFPCLVGRQGAGKMQQVLSNNFQVSLNGRSEGVSTTKASYWAAKFHPEVSGLQGRLLRIF
ncbi:MAG: hypothetical protein IIA61_00220 [Candidatus Marinimicrobia bacterium]|nr:hypothetical protein [Candidatus Neomarinimicrobiota bacterium]